MIAKAQSALEYLMIIALVLGLIIPITYLFFRYSSQSTEQIIDSQINQIGNSIVDTAEIVYFSGENSKIILEINMPERVGDIYILANRELVFEISSEIGETEAVFFSSVGIPMTEGTDLTEIAGQGRNKIKIESVDDGAGGTEVRIGKI